jgi:hypothetical protein
MNSNTTQPRYSHLVTRLSIVAFFLLALCTPINADEFRSTSPYRVDSRFTDATLVSPSASYQSYESTIYEPFADDAPSSSSDNGARKIGGRQNSFVDRPDTPPAPGSPIGEPWIMLAFAAMAAVVIALRKKQTA